MIVKILAVAGLLNGLIAWRVLMDDGSTRVMTTTQIVVTQRGTLIQ
jgi:hypothetical protein